MPNPRKPRKFIPSKYTVLAYLHVMILGSLYNYIKPVCLFALSLMCSDQFKIGLPKKLYQGTNQ